MTLGELIVAQGPALRASMAFVMGAWLDRCGRWRMDDGQHFRVGG